jgi:hypothetical protein
VVVTFHHATLTTRRLLRLTWAGLAPAGTRQLAWRTDMIPIPIYFFPKSYRRDVFVPITPDLKLLRKAFNNIGIEPNSGWSYEVPVGQIRIHVGLQRDDESAPTELTTMMAGEGDIERDEIRRQDTYP